VARLSELTASARRLALVGLAKNTGKTVTLAALLRELEAQGRRVGVTSVGRDGEERDAIDARIEKPRVRLPAGSLVATTDGLLRASGLAHELLEETGVRTPLGRVLIARLNDAGAIEVAGPSAASDVRAASEAMLEHGAEQVLIDGAVDRRAASSPQVSDGLVMATGAVLDRDLERVVAVTRDAVDLARVRTLEDDATADGHLRDLAARTAGGGELGGEQGASADADARRSTPPSLLVADEGEPVTLPPRFVLTAEGEQVAALLGDCAGARWLLLAGAVPERFLASLLPPLARRRGRLTVVVADPTKLFLASRGPAWYERQGVELRVLRRTPLLALTVNPVAPRSHRFGSAELRAGVEATIADVPVFDVLESAG